MEHVDIACIVVAAAPYSIDKPYDYLIPQSLRNKICPGVRVTVPFGRGNSSSEGIVLACTTGDKKPQLKSIDSVLDDETVLRKLPFLTEDEIEGILQRKGAEEIDRFGI